jgi:lipid-binding SYLF domain-containing protein
MKFNTILAVATAAIVSFASTGAFAQSEKEKKQAEVRKQTEQSLADFYKNAPELKAEVAKAPGYAVFTTYGLSFLIGGAGGKGVAVDNKTKKVTYMDLAGASAGLTIGAQEARYLYVFKDAASLQRFIDSGWDAGAELAAGAGAGEKSGTAQAATFTGGRVYMLTKAGFQASAAVGGTKVWKDKELN